MLLKLLMMMTKNLLHYQHRTNSMRNERLNWWNNLALSSIQSKKIDRTNWNQIHFVWIDQINEPVSMKNPTKNFSMLKILLESIFLHFSKEFQLKIQQIQSIKVEFFFSCWTYCCCQTWFEKAKGARRREEESDRRSFCWSFVHIATN